MIKTCKAPFLHKVRLLSCLKAISSTKIK